MFVSNINRLLFRDHRYSSKSRIVFLYGQDNESKHFNLTLEVILKYLTLDLKPNCHLSKFLLILPRILLWIIRRKVFKIWLINNKFVDYIFFMVFNFNITTVFSFSVLIILFEFFQSVISMWYYNHIFS